MGRYQKVVTFICAMHFSTFRFYNKAELIPFYVGQLFSKLKKLILNMLMAYETSFLQRHRRAASALCVVCFVSPMVFFQDLILAREISNVAGIMDLIATMMSESRLA